MKILLGQSYFRVLDPKELERQKPYPPLGSLYAATIIRQMGHQVIFYDGMLSEGPSDFVGKIRETHPDLLLIYDDEFNYLTKMCLSNMREAACTFIKTAQELEIPSVIYSSDATDFSSFYLDAGCDAILYGEGEITLQEVLPAFEHKNFSRQRNEIRGLKFRDAGKIICTLPRKMLDTPDELPDPDYSFVDINAYREIWLKNHGYFSMNVSTTRGCPYKCNWCAKPIYGKSYHSRAPENVALQFRHLKESYLVDHIWITDDIFGLKPNWIKEFGEATKKVGLTIPYKCLSRPDLLIKEDTMRLLKESGCQTIWIGAESGSQKILDGMDKGTSVAQIYEATRLAHSFGIEVAFFIQFGYTGEAWEDIKMTRKMIRDCVPEDIGISVSYPLPGTKFYERVKEQLKQKTNWRDSDDMDMMFSGHFERSFYKILHRFVHMEYRIFRIVKQKEWNKLPHLLFYMLKYSYLRFKLAPYLKLSPASK